MDAFGKGTNSCFPDYTIFSIIELTSFTAVVKFLASLGWGGGLTRPPSKLRLTEPLLDPWYWPLREVSAGSADPQLKTTLDVSACEIVMQGLQDY